ncbi:uncharacterized protein LOC119876217 [Canis lupus familiaris]|uniref:uncharacterized protein LOC119876217 n=1 Tax=Canis lupus familiaris TaxID=9615 RepID=UPI0018F37D74|nr:uncharacterized protein LOC119876217 [Canis lupus familiaris]
MDEATPVTALCELKLKKKTILSKAASCGNLKLTAKATAWGAERSPRQQRGGRAGGRRPGEELQGPRPGPHTGADAARGARRQRPARPGPARGPPWRPRRANCSAARRPPGPDRLPGGSAPGRPASPHLESRGARSSGRRNRPQRNRRRPEVRNGDRNRLTSRKFSDVNNSRSRFGHDGRKAKSQVSCLPNFLDKTNAIAMPFLVLCLERADFWGQFLSEPAGVSRLLAFPAPSLRNMKQKENPGNSLPCLLRKCTPFLSTPRVDHSNCLLFGMLLRIWRSPASSPYFLLPFQVRI